MFDAVRVAELLSQILEAIERIERRFIGIASPTAFEETPEGRDRLDGICMMLIAIGEALKRIDSKTNHTFLQQYPEIPWEDVKGTRDILSHGYFDVDVDVVYDICRNRLEELKAAIQRMLSDLGQDR